MTYAEKPRDGFVLGKFMPPHQGHVYLCEFARQYCERLTILVSSLPDEPIPGELRYRWMKELFPDCRVVWINRPLPQEPTGPDDQEFWDIWRETSLEACRTGYKQDYIPIDLEGNLYWRGPDVVFASEEYGRRLAAELGARFVPVDIGRTCRDISGTRVRENPFENWSYIPHVVRPYFVKRVTLFGPESTGKTTLAAALAEHYETVMVPEYGRIYTETFGADVNADDLDNIVAGHLASVAAAKRQANRILIEDTDPVMSAVWSDMLLGKRDPWFANFTDHSDLYLLCDVDIPWVDDGTRYFRNDEDRRRFFAICEAELKARGVPYRVIRGRDRDARLAAAKLIIDELILGKTIQKEIRCDRGFSACIGDEVRFQGAARIGRETIDSGVIETIDGAYIGIRVQHGRSSWITERYPNEIIEIISAGER